MAQLWREEIVNIEKNRKSLKKIFSNIKETERRAVISVGKLS